MGLRHPAYRNSEQAVCFTSQMLRHGLLMLLFPFFFWILRRGLLFTSAKRQKRRKETYIRKETNKTVCCSVHAVLQCVAVCMSQCKCVAVCMSRCTMLHCACRIAVCCSVLQCVAVCMNVVTWMTDCRDVDDWKRDLQNNRLILTSDFSYWSCSWSFKYGDEISK